MRIFTTLLTLVMLLAVGQLHAQKKSKKSNKDELKHWKNEVKKYKKNPLALKALTEDYKQFKTENIELQDKVNSFESERSNDIKKIAQLEREISNLNNSLMAAEENARQMALKQEDLADKGFMAGTVFRVQIGAYAETSIPGDLDGAEDELELEEEDGLQKILVGQFREIGKAEELQEYMKTIGVSDAWIVPYRDGIRITMEEAMNN